MPTWELVEDSGTIMLHWRGSPGENIQGLPLGKPDEVAEKLADWLMANGYGDMMADALATADFAE